MGQILAELSSQGWLREHLLQLEGVPSNSTSHYVGQELGRHKTPGI